MKAIECEFEEYTLAAVLQSRWPHRVDDELRTHVATCPICSDVVAIAGTFEEAREESRDEAVVPESGRVWWVAQMRARREAAKTAGRPITAAQVMAFSCAMAVLGACFGATSTWFQRILARVASAVAGVDAASLLASATALLAEHGALVVAMIAMVLLIPAAVFLAIGKD